MSGPPKRVAVFGAGYVGLVTGACFADLGHTVVIRDVLADRVDALQRGEIPIYEPGLAELIAANTERLTFTTSVAEAIDGADFVYVAVGTPPTYSGRRRSLCRVDGDRRAPRDRQGMRRRDEEHGAGRYRD